MNRDPLEFKQLAHLVFQESEQYPCAYLPGRQAVSQIAAPILQVNGKDYSVLVKKGFHRSSLIVYRPNCQGCQRCFALRIPVNEFFPDRTQRRLFKKHRQIEVQQMPLVFNETHYQLYLRYQASRHPNGGMECNSRNEYEKIMLQTNVESCLFEFSENNQVKMVCVTDILEDGLSAVYTFFDPDEPAMSWGTYAILRQIELCRQAWLPSLYLGYWIPECQKMSYKANFQPAEVFIDEKWQRLDEVLLKRIEGEM